MNIGMMLGIIFSVILIGLFFPIGLKQIQDMNNYNEVTLYSKVLKDIKYNVERIYRMQEGSIIEFELKIPQNYKFCFVNPKTIYVNNKEYLDYTHNNIDPANIHHSWDYTDNKYKSVFDEKIKEIKINGDVKKPYNNVVLFKNNRPIFFYRIDNVLMRNNFCVEGNEYLLLKNKGTYVELYFKR